MKNFVLLFFIFLSVHFLYAAPSPVSKEYVQKLVENSRTKDFSSVLQQEKDEKIEVFRSMDASGKVRERRDYYHGTKILAQSFRLPEGHYMVDVNGVIVKEEIEGNFKDEEAPVLAWDWAWDVILRDMGGDCIFQEKNVSLNGQKLRKITIQTAVTSQNLAKLTKKTELEIKEKLSVYQKSFPSVKQLFVDPEQEFIVKATMFNAEGKKLIEVNWGKISYGTPDSTVFLLPEKKGKIPVAKQIEDFSVIANKSVQSSANHSSLFNFVQKHLFWILIGISVISFIGVRVLAHKQK